MTESRPRSAWILWLGGFLIVLVAVGTFILTPFRECPNCEGSGLGMRFRSGPGQMPCRYCEGGTRVSLFRKWTKKTQETYVCGVDYLDYSRIKSFLSREGIPVIPGDGSLGVMSLYSDSPPHAARARKLLEQDAREKGYKLY